MSEYRDNLRTLGLVPLLGEHIDQQRMRKVYEDLLQDAKNKLIWAAEEIKKRNLHNGTSPNGAMYDTGLGRPIWVRMSNGYLKVTIEPIIDARHVKTPKEG